MISKNDPQSTYTALLLLRQDSNFLKYMKQHLLSSDCFDLWNIFKNLDDVEVNEFYIGHKKSSTLFHVELLKKLVKNYEDYYNHYLKRYERGYKKDN